MARRRMWLVAVAVAALGLGFPVHEARAQGEANASTPVVEVYCDSSAPQGLEDAVTRAVGRVGAVVELVRAARAPHLEATRFARVNLRQSVTSVEVEVVFARGGKTMRTLARAATPTVEAEEVALVVESALESELDAIRERPPPPPPPVRPPPPAPVAKNREAPAPTPVAVPPSTGDVGLFAGILGGAGAYGSREGPVARLGGEMGVASRARFRPSISMRASYIVPFHAGERRAEADVSVVNLRVVPAAQWVELDRASFGVGVGLGVDVVFVSARSDVPGARAEPEAFRVDPVIAPSVVLRYELASNVALSASLGVDVGLASRSWFADDGGTRVGVFEPLRARPFVLVGIDFAVLGADTSLSSRRASAPRAAAEAR